MKKTASLKIKRASATLAMAGALLAVTGCSYVGITPQATTNIYDASDGVSSALSPEDGQRVEMRNLMVISEAEGEPGRLIGTIYNTGDAPQTVTLALGEGQNVSIDLEPGEVHKLEDEANTLIIDTTTAAPGMVIAAESSIGATTDEFSLPVLDGTLPEYEPYLPAEAEATPTSYATANS